ncbi:hypothetical protein JGU66_27705 [Myxococcaceae bacterium JPH2]|nr:hypothetical protein [Myxococcaceae bacterium JPH2]
MGHQVNFFALPDDVERIRLGVDAIEPMVIITSRSDGPEPRIVSGFDFEEKGRRWFFYYLVRMSDLRSVVVRHIPTQGYWEVDSLVSPVVEYTDCKFDGEALDSGRIYYVDGFYGESREWVEKGEEFRLWAKKVLSVVRKCLKRQGGRYFGSSAIEWIARENAEYVSMRAEYRKGAQLPG